MRATKGVALDVVQPEMSRKGSVQPKNILVYTCIFLYSECTLRNETERNEMKNLLLVMFIPRSYIFVQPEMSRKGRIDMNEAKHTFFSFVSSLVHPCIAQLL